MELCDRCLSSYNSHKNIELNIILSNNKRLLHDNNIDVIKSCKVDFESKTATVVFDDKILDSKKIASIITKKTLITHWSG